MDIQKEALLALDVLQLKESAFHELALDRRKLNPALIFIGIGSLASSLGLILFPVHVGWITYRPDFAWVLGATIGGALSQALILFLVGLLAEKIFHSKVTSQGFLQVLGYASLLNLVGLIPGFGSLASLWLLVVSAKLLHTEGKLDPAPIALILLIVLFVFGSLTVSQFGYYGAGLF